MFVEDTPPTTLRARILNYALEAYKVFIEGVVVETSLQAHSIGKFKGLVPFLIVKSDLRAITLPPPLTNECALSV